MSDWKKVDSVPKMKGRKKGEARIKAEEDIMAFVESRDACWEMDITDENIMSVRQRYLNAIRESKYQVKVRNRGNKLYLSRD